MTTPHLEDTITALASAPGAGARAIVRVSGPQSVAVIALVFRSAAELEPTRRCFLPGELLLPSISASLPADVYLWPAPHSYTGQNVAEIHTLSSPPLLEQLLAALLQAGARAAQPGEFTMRAFLAGKLDLTRAEAVVGVIEAGDHAELKQALTQLAGGVGRPMQELREDLLNLLADVEAGLDFADEDIHFVGQDDLLKRLGKGLALVILVSKQLQQRAVSDHVFRVVLAGKPNAGKSSLFNALAGATALVSPQPGTTRDYLVQRLKIDEALIELVDTPGWRNGGDTIEVQAQTLAREQSERADLVLLCLRAGDPLSAVETELLGRTQPPVVGVSTQCDRASASPQFLPTSAVTGMGLAGLKRVLAERARSRAQPALAPSLSRCRHHVETCLEYLRRAHAIVLYNDPPELLALELRGALEQLGEMVGAVYTDDLLDRIFSRFCIGK
jgi:tRNA modification GTPase